MAKNNAELMARTSNKQVSPLAEFADRYRGLIEARSKDYEGALPSGFDVNRFKAVVLTHLTKNADEMSKCTPISVMAAVAQLAQSGLDLSLPNEAHFVRFGNNCTMVRGYKGYRKMVLRNPELINVKSEAVYENDVYQLDKGDKPRVIHTYDPFGERGALRGFYAIAYFANGTIASDELGVEEVEKHAKRFIKADRGAFGEVKSKGRDADNFEAYGLKTALIRLCYRHLNLYAELADELRREFEGPEPTFVAEAARPAVANGGTWPAITADQAAAALEAEELPPPDAPDAEDYA